MYMFFDAGAFAWTRYWCQIAWVKEAMSLSVVGAKDEASASHCNLTQNSAVNIC